MGTGHLVAVAEHRHFGFGCDFGIGVLVDLLLDLRCVRVSETVRLDLAIA